MEEDIYIKIKDSISSDPDNIYIKDYNIKKDDKPIIILGDFLDDPNHSINDVADSNMVPIGINESSDLTFTEASVYGELIKSINDTHPKLPKYKQIINDNKKLIDNCNYIEYNNNNNTETNKFFDCFNLELSINNAITCSELNQKSATTYVFENENQKKELIEPFDKPIIDHNLSRIELYQTNEIKKLSAPAPITYDYIDEFTNKKNNKNNQRKQQSRLGAVALSAIVLMGSAWINNII